MYTYKYYENIKIALNRRDVVSISLANINGGYAHVVIRDECKSKWESGICVLKTPEDAGNFVIETNAWPVRLTLNDILRCFPNTHPDQCIQGINLVANYREEILLIPEHPVDFMSLYPTIMYQKN